ETRRYLERLAQQCEDDDTWDLHHSTFDDDVIVLHDLQGFSITPFHGEGTRAGTITTDLSPPGLGRITDITSRTDEVARSCNLLQASCTGMEDNPFPPFTNHSFEEFNAGRHVRVAGQC
ncbi:PREDICTED: uncharacterized protein LOC107328108, partial [Acropora digitifera]|uniref:uncharacterized protein LOC107328108 n=1 Tax=Acropora digitifera TaxID=70779 RepID=UPI00077A5292